MLNNNLLTPALKNSPDNKRPSLRSRTVGALLLAVSLFMLSAAWALPPEVELDRLLLQAKSAFDAGNFTKAVESFAKAEKLGVTLPPTFYFHYGLASANSGQHEKGRAMLEQYLNASGAKGKFYKEALVEINNIERAINTRDAAIAAAAKERAAEVGRKAKEYYEAKKSYEVNIIKCEDSEFDIERNSRERAFGRAKADCDRKFGLPNYLGIKTSVCANDNHPLAIAQDRAAKRRMTSYDKDSWCKSRYTAPRPPN